MAAPAKTDTAAYGRYLTSTMGCAFCHTTADAQMTPIPGRDFAGDNEFQGPWGVVRSANLSPHETGLGIVNDYLKMQKPVDHSVDKFPKTPRG